MDARELYDPEFRKLIKSKKPTIIIPIGSLEQHGAHLPITTDSDIVTEIASRLAKKCDFIVFPTISYGISDEHSPFFNASVTEQAFEDFIGGLANSALFRKWHQVTCIFKRSSWKCRLFGCTNLEQTHKKQGRSCSMETIFLLAFHEA